MQLTETTSTACWTGNILFLCCYQQSFTCKFYIVVFSVPFFARETRGCPVAIPFCSYLYSLYFESLKQITQLPFVHITNKAC